jgi:hypothetical protein
MKNLYLSALVFALLASTNAVAADDNCDFTSYVGVCPACDAETLVDSSDDAEVRLDQGKSVTMDHATNRKDDCCVFPKIIGICETH